MTTNKQLMLLYLTKDTYATFTQTTTNKQLMLLYLTAKATHTLLKVQPNSSSNFETNCNAKVT